MIFFFLKKKLQKINEETKNVMRNVGLPWRVERFYNKHPTVSMKWKRKIFHSLTQLLERFNIPPTHKHNTNASLTAENMLPRKTLNYYSSIHTKKKKKKNSKHIHNIPMNGKCQSQSQTETVYFTVEIHRHRGERITNNGTKSQNYNLYLWWCTGAFASVDFCLFRSDENKKWKKK